MGCNAKLLLHTMATTIASPVWRGSPLPIAVNCETETQSDGRTVLTSDGLMNRFDDLVL